MGQAIVNKANDATVDKIPEDPMKAAIIIVLLSVWMVTGCQKAQSHAQLTCPTGKDLPTHTLRYPLKGDNKGPYPVIIATVPNPMGKEEFLSWLNAQKDTHFVVALPPEEVEHVSKEQLQRLLVHLGCRYAMDLARVEYLTHRF